MKKVDIYKGVSNLLQPPRTKFTGNGTARSWRWGSHRIPVVLLDKKTKSPQSLPVGLIECIPEWQVKKILAQSGSVSLAEVEQGTVVFIRISQASKKSPYLNARDTVGQAMSQIARLDYSDRLDWIVLLDQAEAILGAWAGIEIGRYRFKDYHMDPRPRVYDDRLFWSKSTKKIVESAKRGHLLGQAVNFARHLVNLPGVDLHPQSYASLLKRLFSKNSKMRVQVIQGNQLKRENLDLIQAVGAGSPSSPCIVHLSYRPSQRKSAKTPVAFAGKGVTFDTGGINLKPAAGMRLMKKDMGGSATTAALAWWVTQVGLTRPVDFWLALAENAVDEHCIRPGDVFKTRNGISVEIDNTDAEGRLVLADALQLAVDPAEKWGGRPQWVVDTATLTGSARVALGLDVAALFSNQDRLADKVLKCSEERGDPAWRLPLYQPYFSKLDSNFATMTNCADAFGGAITAALFLEKFLDSVPWAHLDMMGWNISATGAWREAGGSGQQVQALCRLLESS